MIQSRQENAAATQAPLKLGSEHEAARTPSPIEASAWGSTGGSGWQNTWYQGDVFPRYSLIHTFDRIFTLNYMQHFPELNIHSVRNTYFSNTPSESSTAVKVRLLPVVEGIEGSLLNHSPDLSWNDNVYTTYRQQWDNQKKSHFLSKSDSSGIVTTLSYFAK